VNVGPGQEVNNLKKLSQKVFFSAKDKKEKQEVSIPPKL
jgi:hypothetical protein